MQRMMWRFAGRLGRVLSLVLLAALGSIILMRYAPGYFTDSREMDAAYAEGARVRLSSLHDTQGSLPALLRSQLGGWIHGDLGRSRHYDVPVAGLLRERSATTARLLLQGIGTGWLIAFAFALLLSARRTDRGELLLASSTATLLAIPAGVLAMLSLLMNKGGPVLVLALLIAVRDFKLLYRLLRTSWRAPYLLQARAQGFSFFQTARVHLLPVVGFELLAIAMMSLVLALSALVPVEVVFDVPGLGQLAWSAATNRDLPVLVAVTAVLAACIGLASLIAAPDRATEAAQCA
ncbi:MAG: ABC transporter permease subunit [Janthinobacterium lividum]